MNLDPEEPQCFERFYPYQQPLSGSLHGHVCTRPKGHPGLHRRGEKVNCGKVYVKGDGMYYCNLDKGHPGHHDRELPWTPEPVRPKPTTAWGRALAWLMR